MIEDRNLKPGMVLEATHKKKDYRCEVVKGEEGKLIYRLPNGKEFTSPSRAGTEVMGGVACNGWRFWSVAGSAKPKAAKAATKATTRTTVAKKTPKKAKRATKAKPVVGGANGEESAPVEKPVNCGECGQEFPTSREAGDHMRDAHSSPEAAGVGG